MIRNIGDNLLGSGRTGAKRTPLTDGEGIPLSIKVVGSFMSGLKRKMGSALTSRWEPALFLETKLRIPTYAI